MNPVERNYRNHDVDEAQAFAMDQVREAMKAAASVVAMLVPESREKSLALTKLEEAMFFGVAGIARPQ